MNLVFVFVGLDLFVFVVDSIVVLVFVVDLFVVVLEPLLVIKKSRHPKKQ